MNGIKWIVGAAFAVLVAVTAYAQLPGITRKAVQEQDLGSMPGRQAVVAHVEFAPGAIVPMHTHAGEEIGYVVEGELELQVQGQATRIASASDHRWHLAARTLLRALGTKNDARYNLKIIDNGEPGAGRSHAPASDDAVADNGPADSPADDTTSHRDDDLADLADEDDVKPKKSEDSSSVVSKTRKELEELDDLDV